MKRVLAVLLSIILIVAIIPIEASAAHNYTGTFGSGFEWIINPDNGAMAITGVGALPDYDKYQDVPWVDHADKVKAIYMDNTITHLGDNLFYGMVNLTSVNFSKNLETIGKFTFYGCDSLAVVKIPNTVTNIGESAFRLCNNLTTLTIGTGVKTISDYAFYFCLKLNSITLPASVESVGNYAFENCDAVTSITLNDGLKTIGINAFKACNKVVTVNIPASVSYIGTDAFLECKILEAINVAADNTAYSSERGLLFNKNKTVIIKCPAYAPMTSYKLPATVTDVEARAFYYCLFINDLDFSNAVRYGDRAVYRCVNLKTVNMPSNTQSIGEGLFYGCVRLDHIDLPSGITEISENMFGFCSSMKQIDITGGITTINSGAFYYDESLKVVNVPTSVTTIKATAFRRCNNLEVVTIPAQTTTLEENIFLDTAGVTVRCYENSPAHTYCVNNGIDYMLIGSSVNVSVPVTYVGAEGKTSASAAFTPKAGGSQSVLYAPYLTSKGGGTATGSIAEGAYSIKVSKAGHTSCTVSQVYAGIQEVPQDLVVLYAGDVNGDGYINAKDNAAMNSAYGAKSGSSNYNVNADFNEDGYINAKDRALIIYNYSKSSQTVSIL